MLIHILVLIMQVSERGQVTIPKAYRTQFGLLPNTEVEFVARNNELVLVRKRKAQANAIRSLRGRKKTGMTTDELMRLLRDAD